MTECFTVYQQAADGLWLAVQYGHSETQYWPCRTRVALCDSQAHARAVASVWADKQGIAVLSEDEFADKLLEDLA